MRNLHELDQYRINHWIAQTDKSGAFKVYVGGRSFLVLASVDFIGEDGLWEHISVTPCNKKRNTCPSWEEMAEIKDMFFNPEDECIQYHPKHSRYINFHDLCLHIWRPADEKLRYPDRANIQTLEDRDLRLEQLWADFCDVPMDPDTERIEEPFLEFPVGTEREDIWHWFDERHSKGVAYLLYGGAEDYVPEARRLYGLKGLCTECDSESCVFNPQGVCLAPFVTGHAPAICDDGCGDYCYKEA